MTLILSMENYLNIVSEQGLFLISKLYKNAALFEVKTEPKIRKRGRPALYEEQFNLDKTYLKSSQKDDKETTLETYQIEARSKAMIGQTSSTDLSKIQVATEFIKNHLDQLL